ncbi:LysR family transcriptional regulator [Bacillus sp. CECT 9360]|uniref:LysR family transcriptional regulator n=1 Tax=Bacillus sp. CECT 9360 TaxID=2845821 RepID=UPI001E5549B6|nr:LysR family transcriptional regulator [Bacillus sp. CECT 9360]CAH0345362.1 HTH-type transcriptional regulator GltC [Bacillus sp. CECT 9360]
MDLRQLRYFLSIAEEGQISRAAKKLHMAQPPLSQQLQQMEEELGVTLVERKRNGKKMELTEAGKILYEKAQSILHSFEESILEVKETGEGMKGTLSIGVVLSCVSYLPAKIERFNQKYPNVSFKLLGGDPYEINRYLEKREIELAIVHPPLAMNGLLTKELGQEPYVFVFPKKWSSLGSKKSINMKEIENIPLLLIHRTKGEGIYDEIKAECNRVGIHPNILCECPDVNILLSLVSSGIGASIVPKTSIPPFLNEGIKVLNINDTSLQSETVLAWNQDRYLSRAAKRFIDLF